MEIHLGRSLSQYETVDHIDENTLNDDIKNLQILSRVDNAYKSAWKVKRPKANCVLCGKEFELSKDQYNKRSRKKAGPFCSKQCSGKYGALLQNSKIEKITSTRPEPTYYKILNEEFKTKTYTEFLNLIKVSDDVKGK